MGKFIKKLIYRIMELFVPSSAIIIFHHITGKPAVCNSGCILDYDRFIEVIETFKDYDNVYNVIKNPYKKRISITFDDALSDLFEIAYPILKERNIPFTIFVISDFIDKPGYITTEQLKTLSEDSLVTIGSHGVSHDILAQMTIDQQRFELYESKKKLENLIERKVDLFAYSHGIYNKETLKLAKVYKYGFSTRSYPLNFITKFRYEMPRYNIDNECYDIALRKIKKLLRAKQYENRKY